MERTVLMIALLTLLATASFAEDKIRPYVSLETGYSWTQMDSGGFNTLGPHNNTNKDTDSSFLFGAKAGIKNMRLSSDISYTYRDSFNFKTDSFAPPTPTFFYNSKVTVYNIMLSAYYDIFSYKDLTLFAGAGLGASFVDIKTDDTIVSGHSNDTSFAWQAEVGMEYPLSSHLSIYSSYQYVDLGKTKTDISSKAANTPAGSFEADLTANELGIGLRYLF